MTKKFNLIGLIPLLLSSCSGPQEVSNPDIGQEIFEYRYSGLECDEYMSGEEAVTRFTLRNLHYKYYELTPKVPTLNISINSGEVKESYSFSVPDKEYYGYWQIKYSIHIIDIIEGHNHSCEFETEELSWF